MQPAPTVIKGSAIRVDTSMVHPDAHVELAETITAINGVWGVGCYTSSRPAMSFMRVFCLAGLSRKQARDTATTARAMAEVTAKKHPASTEAAAG